MQTTTIGVINEPRLHDHQSDLWAAVIEEFRKQPEVCTDGGNDRDFFSMIFLGVKLFVAGNEVNGLTVMLPEEY